MLLACDAIVSTTIASASITVVTIMVGTAMAGTTMVNISIVGAAIACATMTNATPIAGAALAGPNVGDVKTSHRASHVGDNANKQVEQGLYNGETYHRFFVAMSKVD